MRYFAILKDSFREAVDSKVLLVLLGLTTLTIGMVATLSFKLHTADRSMRQFFPTGRELPLQVILDSHKPEKRAFKEKTHVGHFRLDKVELVRGEPDAPESDYALSVVYTTWAGEDGADPAKKQAEAIQALKQVFAEPEEFGLIRLGDINLVEDNAAKGKLSFRVIVHGTPKTLRIWYADLSMLGVLPIGKLLMAALQQDTGPIGFQLYVLARLVLYFGAWVAVLTSVIVTSFFIPNMLRKGAIDLMLAKPLQRWLLLVYKYIGGLMFIFLNASYAVGGIWLVLGIRTGVWPNGSLLLILTITFFFAILYAISTFVAVQTRSTVTSIIVTIVAWAAFFGIGSTHKYFAAQLAIEQEAEKRGQPAAEEERWGDSFFVKLLGFVHDVTPRTSDLDQLDEVIVFADFMTGRVSDIDKFDTSQRNWWTSLLVSSAWIVAFVGLSCFWFTIKDY